MDELVAYYSDLQRLIKTTVFIMAWKFFKFFHMLRPLRDRRNQHLLMQSSAVTATEYHNAWLYLLHREQVKRLDVSQVKRLVPVSMTASLTKFQKTFQLICLGSRVKTSQKVSRLAKLVVKYYPHCSHRK